MARQYTREQLAAIHSQKKQKRTRKRPLSWLVEKRKTTLAALQAHKTDKGELVASAQDRWEALQKASEEKGHTRFLGPGGSNMGTPIEAMKRRLSGEISRAATAYERLGDRIAAIKEERKQRVFLGGMGAAGLAGTGYALGTRQGRSWTARQILKPTRPMRFARNYVDQLEFRMTNEMTDAIRRFEKDVWRPKVRNKVTEVFDRITGTLPDRTRGVDLLSLDNVSLDQLNDSISRLGKRADDIVAEAPKSDLSKVIKETFEAPTANQTEKAPIKGLVDEWGEKIYFKVAPYLTGDKPLASIKRGPLKGTWRLPPEFRLPLRPHLAGFDEIPAATRSPGHQRAADKGKKELNRELNRMANMRGGGAQEKLRDRADAGAPDGPNWQADQRRRAEDRAREASRRAAQEAQMVQSLKTGHHGSVSRTVQELRDALEGAPTKRPAPVTTRKKTEFDQMEEMVKKFGLETFSDSARKRYEALKAAAGA